MKPAYVFILIAYLGFASCANKNNQQETLSEPAENGETELLESEVNRVHDEVMSRMGEIYAMKNKLKALDTSASLSPEKKLEVDLAILRLDSAYDGMMDWMHKYKPEEHKTEEEIAREYLEDEMEKIKLVGEKIQEALDKANAVASGQ
jgi:hypothetical protein